jgi:hypothetical protein
MEVDVLVPIDRSLKKEIEITNLISLLETQLNKIPNIQTHRNENEITQLVCSIVENYCKAKKYKIDKKEVVKSFLEKLFGLNAEELTKLDKQIEYLHSHRLINKVSTAKYVGHYLWAFLKKKVL